MKIAVCIDEKNGMLFAKRRQSMDRILRENFLTLTGGAVVWMSPYTAGQFADTPDRIRADAEYLEKAQENDWCFVEDGDLEACADKITQIVLYRWNRRYPADTWFPIELFAHKWTLVAQRDFPGSSHEQITEEVYNL